MRCAAFLAIFVLVIVNWRSPVGLRSSSSNFDLLAFSATTVLIPICLLWASRSLPPIPRWLTLIPAAFLTLFAALVVFWNVPSVIFMIHRGVEMEPLLATVPRGSSRVAAYQVETSPAGAFVRLRLEQAIFPGLHLYRDIAYVDEPYIDALALQSPTTICVSFSAHQPDLAGQDRQLQFLLDLGPLISWKMPTRLDARSPIQSCSRGR